MNLSIIWQMFDGVSNSSLMKYSSYGAGTFFLLFYEQIFGKGFKRVNRRLWQLHLLSWGAILSLSLLEMASLEQTYFVYSMLNLATILYVAIATIVKAQSGSSDAKIFTIGLIGLIFTLIFDISLAIQMANYAPSQTTTWGLLLFTFCLTIILVKKYKAKGTNFIYEPLIFHHDPITLKIKADSMVIHTLKGEISRLLYLNERNKRLVDAGIDVHKKEPLSRNFTLMEEALHHMNNMILAVKKTDDIKLQFQRIHLNRLVLDTIHSFQAALGQSQLDFDIQLGNVIEMEIDPLHIRECLINLLSNSVEAIEHPNGKIKVELYRQDSQIILEVSDNGKGIHPHHVKEVITPLFTTKKSSTNFGVGLYYVYFVINKHGGTLTIPYSEVGKGTTIRIQLPYKTKTKPCWSVNVIGKNKSHAG
jgi:signal transduction histidine kinase